MMPEAECDAKDREQKEAEEAEKLEARIAAMSSLEKRRYKAEEKRKARIAEDLAPEKMLKDEMERSKAKINGKALIYERLRGLVTLEDDSTQDYELSINFSEVMLKPLKNTANRLTSDQLGFMTYGRGALEDSNEKMLRQVLKMSKT